MFFELSEGGCGDEIFFMRLRRMTGFIVKREFYFIMLVVILFVSLRVIVIFLLGEIFVIDFNSFLLIL